MKRLSFCIGFLGLVACSDASGANGQNPSQTVAATGISEPVSTGEQVISGWTVDKTKSTLWFSGMQSGTVFTGSFSGFDAVINFDPENLAATNVVVTIDMNSAKTDEAESTDALPGKEWFYVKKYPVAKFKATDFKHLGGNKYEAKGNLTIRDIAKEIVLPFTLNIEDGHANMDATLTLNRTAFKIGSGMWAGEDWVEHDIAVNIHIEAAKNK